MHFFLKVFIVLIFGQTLGILIWWKRLRKSPRLRMLMIGLFTAGNLPWPFFYLAVIQPEPASTWLFPFIMRLFLTWQFGFILWFVFSSLIILIIAFFYKIPQMMIQFFQDESPENPVSVARREFLSRTGRKILWGTALTGAGWGFVRSGVGPGIVSYDISLPDLPKELDGLTIAHLSDLHVGNWTFPGDMPRLLSRTREQKPDMVVITGDIIDHNPLFSQTLIRHLHYLKQVPLGIHAVIGNHDIYTGAREVTQALQSGGINMLRNRHCSLSHLGLPLALIGVDDPGRKWFGSGGAIHLEKAMTKLRPDLFPVLLVHRPTGFYQAAAYNIPLTLCGHTHGGQFGIPGGPNLAGLAYEFTHGLYRIKDETKENVLHVSAGIGAVGLPFRLGVPAEIAMLRLRSQGENTNIEI